MKEEWWRKLVVPVAATLFVWVSPGCPGAGTLSGDDSNDPRDVEGAGERGSTVAAASARGQRRIADWPDGWLVAHEEEWIPVLDQLGRNLHAARGDFQNGDREAAATEVRRGIEYLEAQLSTASAQDRRALSTAITALRAFADRLAGEEEVTLEQLDIAFANAYRSNLEREGLTIEQGTTQPYLDRPATHLQRAVEQYEAGEPKEAAREIDRAAAYLRLEGNRHDLAERAQLVEAAQRLEHVGARVRILDIRDRTELTRVFNPVIARWGELARAPLRPPSLGLMRAVGREGPAPEETRTAEDHHVDGGDSAPR